MILEKQDPHIFTILKHEAERQKTTINLIASENYTSAAVLEATSSLMTNKYAEGYPGKRYYAGCEFVDKAEQAAIERCKQLFGADHVNVQPHAGSQANMAVYFAALKPGDTVMGMSLSEGGHLTHGHAVNFSGIFYKSVSYTVNKETELLDYDEIQKLAEKHKPKLIIAGASAYSRTIDFERFAAIARSVGALFLADIAHIAGLVATKLHPTPIGHADFVSSTTHKTLRGPRGGLLMCKKEYAQALDKAIMPGTQGGPFMMMIAAKAVAFHEALTPEFTTYQEQIIANAQVMAQAFMDKGYRCVAGGTDNHLFILDLRSKNITGREAESALEAAGITVSRSCIPFDPQAPWITSGIRIGTPAITSRGMQEEQALEIVELVDKVIKHPKDTKVQTDVREKVQALCVTFPIYKERTI
jgi:glycine hydroxymethyltransferase